MKLVRDFGYITGQTGLLGLFYLGLMAWIARVLGPEGVGIYAVTISIVQVFFCILVYGLQPAAAKFIPEYRVKGDTKSLVSLILSLYLWRVGLGVVTALILYLSKNLISSFYNLEGLEPALSCGVFLLFIYGIFLLTASCLQGFQKFRQLFLFQSIFVLSTIAAILAFHMQGQEILAPLKGMGVGWSISILYGLAVIIFSLPRQAWRDVNRKLLIGQGRSVMTYALPAGISFVFILLIDNMGNLIVARFVPAATLGYFAFSYRLAGYFSRVNSIWETLYLPKFSEIFSQKKIEHLVKLFSSLLKNLFLLNTVGVGVILFLSPYLIKFLAGEKFAPAIILFQIFVIINIIRGMNPAINSLYYTYQRTNYLVRVSLSKCLVDIVLLLLIVPRFGVVPAAVAILSSWLVIFYYNFYLIKTILKKPFFKREIGFAIFVPGVICLYLLSISTRYLTCPVGPLVSYGACCGVPIVIGVYLLFKGRKEFFQIFKA